MSDETQIAEVAKQFALAVSRASTQE
jgi:hypothetical protein